MRAVVAPYEYTALEEVESPSGERHQVLFLRDRPMDHDAAGQAGGLAGVYWRPEERIRIEDLLAELPVGFQPDALIYWSIEYHPVPAGIQDVPFFTVAVVGDWNLGGQAVQTCGRAFDLLVADRAGCRRLKSIGFPRVRYAPLWGFDPRLHRRLPGVERDLDIVMAGNFNHDIQRERAPWLARIASLSTRYRVCVTTGVYGEEYTRLLCRARIVFNRSIRGEINMRAYEAAACGALLFYERENLEIGQLFMDGEECILYGPDDLEDLVDRYLADEEARRRIAEAGWRRVQMHTNRSHLGILLDVVADDTRRFGSSSCRRKARSPLDERLSRVHQWLTLGSAAAAAAADAELSKVPDRAGPGGMVTHAVALAQAAEAVKVPSERTRLWNEAALALRAVLENRPQCVAARWNLAQVLLAQGDVLGAARQLEEVAAGCEGSASDGKGPDAEDLALPVYPRRYDAFDVELENAWSAHPALSAEWAEGVASVFQWRASEILSDLAFDRGDFAAAASYAGQAARLKPYLAATHFRLARALRAQGRSAEAIPEYRNALALGPMYPQIWVEYAQLLADLGREEEFADLLARVEKISAGCPPWSGVPQMVCRIRPRRREYGREGRQGLRIVACPNWSSEGAWRRFVARLVLACRDLDRWASTFPDALEGSIELVLRVEGEAGAPTDLITSRLARYLEEELRVGSDDLLEITLDCRALKSEDQWLLLHEATCLVVAEDGQGLQHEPLAKAMDVPIIPVDLLGAQPSAKLAAA